jgi:hypothetical protein
MNAKLERVMNSENLSARIRKNGALDDKIWPLETFRGKMVISGGYGCIYGILEWLEGVGAKYRCSCKIWGISRAFVEFWRV